MDEIFGLVERITFQNEDTGYTIAQLKESKKKELTCIVGYIPGLAPGETVRCKGEWKKHLVHGNQFEVKESIKHEPSDLIGIEKYLGSGLIDGIGPVYAKKIVSKFGLGTLEILEKEPGRLKEIKGIGPKKLSRIAVCWQEQKKVKDVMVFLQGYGISPGFAQKIYKRFGDASIKAIKENPYRLSSEINGIGFIGADKVAKTMGVSHNSPDRIAAGINFVLTQLTGNGHSCYPLPLFLREASTILEVTLAEVEKEIDALKEAHQIKVEEVGVHTIIWQSKFFFAEISIAKQLKALLKAPCSLRTIDPVKAIPWAEKELKMELAPAQREAVKLAIDEKVAIITGGPGTGKSTITKAILRIFEKITPKILLLAPTGRAAKRMTEITGKSAFTIHSRLEIDFATYRFKRNEENPLDCDLVVIDESSMIDTLLMQSLLRAIPLHARVLLVGDVNQLPSVGPGTVLKDIIESKRVPTAILTEIFRQAKGSRIITNSHLINQGLMPDLSVSSLSDFFFISKEDPDEVLKTILDLVAFRLPQKYRFNPLTDIQVLAPMKKGVIGIANLNAELQKKLNKNKNGLNRFGETYLVGDKVMQIRNNYTKEVYNGDIGSIIDIDFEDQSLQIDFEGKVVDYLFKEMDEIQLAYAVSIHKYQGSECPCVVIPVHTAHFKMLHRNLLYTGVTRGKKLVILVGSKKALFIAVNNNDVLQRYTGLEKALANVFTLIPNNVAIGHVVAEEYEN
jgi:helicase, putative, RecD/TraA family